MKIKQNYKNAGMTAKFSASPDEEDQNSSVLCFPVGSATRKVKGWYPVVKYPNGGRVIIDILCSSMRQAKLEAWEMVECISSHPDAFTNIRPQPNQLVDLRGKKSIGLTAND